MSKEHPNWKDRSVDPDGFGKSLECQMMVATCEELLHKVQTAILFLRQYDLDHGIPEERMSTGPKHLRVGVDQALVEHGALVALLIEKGVIKYRDYMEAYIEFLERDVETYTKRLHATYGPNVNLG